MMHLVVSCAGTRMYVPGMMHDLWLGKQDERQESCRTGRLMHVDLASLTNYQHLCWLLLCSEAPSRGAKQASGDSTGQLFRI